MDFIFALISPIIIMQIFLFQMKPLNPTIFKRMNRSDSDENGLFCMENHHVVQQSSYQPQIDKNPRLSQQPYCDLSPTVNIHQNCLASQASCYNQNNYDTSCAATVSNHNFYHNHSQSTVSCQSSKNLLGRKPTNACNNYSRTQKYSKQRQKSEWCTFKPSLIDKYSRIFFPLCFFLFHVIYWIVYLRAAN